MKVLQIIYLAFSLLVIAGCQSVNQPEESQVEEVGEHNLSLTPEQKELAGIQTGKMERSLVADVIDCTGIIDVPPTNISTLHAPIDGIVQHIHAIPGLQVKDDQLLIVLADPEIAQLQEDYLYHKSECSYRETEYTRKKRLYEKEAISKKDLLMAENEFNKTKNALKSLHEQLELMGISIESLEQDGITSTIIMRSPFDGYISDVFVNLGMYVDEHKPLVEVVNYEDIHVELFVYSKDIASLEIGQPVRFQLAGTDKSGWAKIELIGKKVDEDSRSVRVHAHMDNYAEELTIGTSLMAEILTNSDSAYTLPEESIISEGDLQFVFTQESNGYLKTQVATGRVFNDQVEISNYSDLLDKTIVIKGAYYLAD